jgi:hypothetical protein
MITAEAEGTPKALVDWAEGGLLRARAGRIVQAFEQGEDIEENVFEDAPIEAYVWTLMVRRWPRNFDWMSGTFRGSIEWPDRIESIAAYDIRFSKSDLDALRGAATDPIPPVKGKGGRPPSEHWPDFCAELAAYIHEEGLPPGRDTEGADVILKRVLDGLAKRGIAASRTTFQPAVQATLRRLRGAPADK